MASELELVLAQYPGCTPLGVTSGQKKVYLASDASVGTFVLKVVVSPSPIAFQRIEREVQLLQQIDSPSYPKVYEIQRFSPTCVIIKEEYIESKPLSQLLGSYSSPLVALELIHEIAEGLRVLWDQNIVHRDIKPDNILITPLGPPKIIDLGIVRALDMQTLTHPMAGGPLTRNYAAPEQLRYSKVEIDARTDQFILGIVLLQLLMGGEHPFDPRVVGSGNDIADNILSDRWARDALDHPDRVSTRALVEKMLASQPYRRFRFPEDLIAAINETKRLYK